MGKDTTQGDGAGCAKVGTAKQASAAFRARYSEFQYTFVQFFTEHLTDLSRSFRGDLGEMLILAVIGQAFIDAYHERGRGNAPEDIRARAWINASRLSDVTGIPRQTVRRKLDALERRGWIERNNEAEWTLRFEGPSSVARRELKELDDRAIDRVALLYSQLSRIAC